jgi:NAD(P)-dependent dehydrogenase (short-subunit alcohol dehydrogenase family)
VTGVSRLQGIGYAVAQQLAKDGFEVATCHWGSYDGRLLADETGDHLAQITRELGATLAAIGASMGMTRQSAWEQFSGQE